MTLACLTFAPLEGRAPDGPAGTSNGPTAQPLPTSIRWSVAVPAPPAAPPVIADSVAVVALQSALVVAYRLADGVEAWRVELAADQPLAADGSRVFAPAGDAVQALNAHDGSIAWRAATGKVTAPLLAEQGWVIVATEGRLTALRADDGTVVWARESGPQHERASCEGDRLYVPLSDGRVLALDLKTGATRWQRTLGGAPTEVLALADRLYVGSADKHLYALEPDDGEVAWRYEVRAPLRGRPAAAGALVLATADNNELRAFSRSDGALRWRLGLKFRPTAGPVVIGPAVLVPGTTRDLRAFAAETHADTGAIELAQPLAVPFAVGQRQGLPILAALTGALTEEWSLLLMETPPPRPSLTVETDFSRGNWQAGMESIIIR